MQNIIKKLLDFFTIENPLLIVALVFLIVFNRFTIVFFNATNHVIIPENYYFAGITVGQDFISSTVHEAYRLLHHLPMGSGSAYGYGIIIPATWVLSFLIHIGVCSLTYQSSCQFLLYDAIVILSISGFVFLCFLLIRKRSYQAFALLLFIIFLLGIPGGRGIETGNIDIILSVLYGFVLILQKKSFEKTRFQHFYVICIGIITGIMLETKLFILPIGIVLFFTSIEPITFLISLLVTCTGITFAPMMYGVTPAPFQVVFGGEKFLTQVTNNLYKMYTYGNNNTRAMVGGILFSVPFLRTNTQLRSFLIFFFGAILFVIILFAPFLSFIHSMIRKLFSLSLKERLQYPFFILLNCYTVASIILWPGLSYDYRFFYLFPLIFILMDKSRTKLQQQFLGIATSALIIRSMFVLHTKIWQVFLIVFFYFFLWVSISEWIDKRK